MTSRKDIGVYYNFKENKIARNRQEEWQKLTQQAEGKLVGHFKELGWTVNILRESNNDIYCLIEVYNEGKPRYFRSILCQNEWLSTPPYKDTFWFICHEVFKEDDYQLEKNIECDYCWENFKDNDLVIGGINLRSGETNWPKHKECWDKVQRGETEEFWTTWKCPKCKKDVKVSKLTGCAFCCFTHYKLK